jgi:hypothetical protein
MSSRTDEAALWMQFNQLQLNTAKTEVLWCAMARHQLLAVSLRIGTDVVAPAHSARDLGIDAGSSMTKTR